MAKVRVAIRCSDCGEEGTGEVEEGKPYNPAWGWCCWRCLMGVPPERDEDDDRDDE